MNDGTQNMQYLAYEIEYIAIVRCMESKSPRDYPNQPNEILNLKQRIGASVV